LNKDKPQIPITSIAADANGSSNEPLNTNNHNTNRIAGGTGEAEEDKNEQNDFDDECIASFSDLSDTEVNTFTRRSQTPVKKPQSLTLA